MQSNNISTLINLVESDPNNKNLLNQLAFAFGQSKQWKNACIYFQRLYLLMPNDANTCFNYAYHLRFAGNFKEAIKLYKEALLLNITQPEEVYLNIAVIYSDYLRQDDDAEKELKQALLINPDYIPAMYNLANLYEDKGNNSEAYLWFNTIIKKHPTYYQALARLVYLKKFNSLNDPIYQKLVSAANDKAINNSIKIDINFALGKLLDDCANYSAAFSHYQLANELDKKTSPQYDRQAQTALVERIKGVFNQEYFAKFPKISDASPVFICGMFRSGSTLAEQILAAHPKITAGGEIEFFIRLTAGSLAPFPESLSSLVLEQYQTIAKDYIEELNRAFPDAEYVIDKRPENYLFIGFIKALFPNARFIYTQRNILDNCLSVYFLRLGHKMSYALDLEDIAHYYQSQVELMSFWQSKFPDDIYCLSYEQLVCNHEKEIRKLIDFVSLEWDEKCLSFYKVNNTVKTASVWQVRQPLYTSSSGRWGNYKQELSALIKKLKM